MLHAFAASRGRGQQKLIPHRTRVPRQAHSALIILAECVVLASAFTGLFLLARCV